MLNQCGRCELNTGQPVAAQSTYGTCVKGQDGYGDDQGSYARLACTAIPMHVAAAESLRCLRCQATMCGVAPGKLECGNVQSCVDLSQHFNPSSGQRQIWHHACNNADDRPASRFGARDNFRSGTDMGAYGIYCPDGVSIISP